MEQPKNEQAPQQPETGVEKTSGSEQGRQPESGQQPAEQSADISQIDQQEGQMNNGQLGGNFDAPGNSPGQA